MKTTLVTFCLCALSVVYSMPTSQAAAPEDCSNITAKTLYEGLTTLQIITKPINMPREFRRDLATFKTKMTALEHACDVYLTVRRGDEEADQDVFEEKTCSWLNSLSENFLGDCTPSDVELFCTQVRLHNTSFRAGPLSLGNFNNVSRHVWITKHLPDVEAREFVCQRVTNNSSCSPLRER